MSLEKAMLGRGQGECVFENTIRLGKALFDVAAVELEMGAQVGSFDGLQFGKISKAGFRQLDGFMNQRRIGLERFLDIEDRR